MMVAALSPNTISVAGLTPVTVTGSNFVAGVTSCLFGTLASLSATVASSTELRCMAPAVAAGSSVYVEVSANAQDYTSSRVPLVYLGKRKLSTTWLAHYFPCCSFCERD